MVSVSESSDQSSLGAGRNWMRSWVARAEPIKRLCGMTVAPRIPTAIQVEISIPSLK